jgi:methylenetetrahydrofolate dehydrogenase (NADP+) / methenyltetrahydrofolate cyclohydrolase
MSKVLLGAPVAQAIKQNVKTKASALRAQGIIPTLAIVRVGQRQDDIAYERSALKVAASLDVDVKVYSFNEDASQEELEGAISSINENQEIHGCLLFRPLPKGIDEATLCNKLIHAKDLDGVSVQSLGGVFAGNGMGFPPCTAQACIELCEFYDVPLEGKHVVVIGRSLVIGKPVAMLFLEKNATVTICHSRTKNLAQITKAADIIVCATGRAKAYGEEYFSPGQVVLDVGINVDGEGNICGDVDFDAVEPLVGAITPVPRGVGAVTTALLMQHLVVSATRRV